MLPANRQQTEKFFSVGGAVIDAAGHTGPALQGRRRHSRGLVGRIRPWRGAPLPPSDEGGGKNRRFLTEGEKNMAMHPYIVSPPVTYGDSPLVRGGQGPSGGLARDFLIPADYTQSWRRRTGGGAHGPRPTRSQAAFPKPCRGRRSRRPVNIRKCGGRRGGAHGPRPTRSMGACGRIIPVTCYLLIEKRPPKRSFFLLRFAVYVQLHLADALYA